MPYIFMIVSGVVTAGISAVASFFIGRHTVSPSPDEIFNIVFPIVLKIAFFMSIGVSFCMLICTEIIKAMFRKREPREEEVVVHVLGDEEKKDKINEGRKKARDSKVIALPRKKIQKS